MRPRIVVLDGFTLNPGDLNWDGMSRLGDLTVHSRTPAEEVVARAAGAAVVLTNKTPLNATHFDQLPELRFIGVLATGYNIVDVAAAKARGIAVANIPTYGTASVAQFAFALLLELCHRVQWHADAVRAGEWQSNADWCFWKSPLVELAGKTMGIAGYGRIGRQTAKIAEAFGMTVIAHDPAPQAGAVATLEEVLRNSDVVSLHCPLFPETKHMIRAETLAWMKPSAILLNTSRGPLVNEADLAAALNDGRLAGAGIDVIAVEPPVEASPLFSARNCLVTPHIAWATREARARLMEIAVENVAAFLAGTPRNLVG